MTLCNVHMQHTTSCNVNMHYACADLMHVCKSPFKCIVLCMCVISLMLLAEDNLASKVAGEENLEQLQYLKGLLDPENLFRNHQLRGLTPDF